MRNGDWNLETPLTASLEPDGNISTLKALMTDRIAVHAATEDGPPTPPDFPWTVGLSPTSRCPRACFFCSHARRNLYGNRLSPDTVRRVLDDLRSMGTKGVIFAGGGDPLAWEHDIARAVETAAEFCDVGIDTNGVLAGRLLSAGLVGRLAYVTVALLAHEPELYREVCGRDQFDTVDRNVRSLVAAATNAPASRRPRINVKLSVNGRSWTRFADMCRYARSLGTNGIFARCMNNFERGQDIELDTEQKRRLFGTIVREVPMADGYAETFARNLVYPSALPPNIRKPSRCWTVLLGHNLGIKTDGECYLCVPTTGRPKYSVGNVNRSPLSNIWGSDRHLEVIGRLDRRMRDGGCDPNRCRHYRLNLVIEAWLHGEVRRPDDSLYDTLHASFL